MWGYRQSILSASLILTAATGHAAGFTPGEWRHSSKLISADVPGVPEFLVRMVAGGGERKSCFTADLAARHQESLFVEEDKASCRTIRLTMAADGALDYAATCINQRFPDPMTVNSTGRWTPTSYAFRSVTTGTRKGKPVRIVTEASGRRAADRCR
ncbi:hypothetical protein ACFB49_38850 [Sphingomonas sp. DBB INV C78]|uniref:DUF3617 domain-containing protein n=1 Tax=Sphingomonas sp. DBB INV C78 TaxID=3349434 RepID=UPI0036D270D8